MRNFKELIVVTSLLVVMAILLTGAAKYGSSEWQNNICRNNLKELYQLHISYQDDNDGIICPRIDRTNKSRWKYWPQFVNKYGKNVMAFYCPANHKAVKMFNADPLEPKVFSLKSVCYGMNYSLGNYKAYNSPGCSKMIKLKQAFNPSYMIFLGDAKTMSLRATKWCWEKDYAPIHSDKANYLTIDGSVKTLGKNELGLSFFSGEKEWKGWKLDKKRWSNIK